MNPDKSKKEMPNPDAHKPPEKKKPRKRKKTATYLGSGRGIIIQKRDEIVLKFLACGPARSKELEPLFRKKNSNEPLSYIQVNRRLNELTRRNYIQKRNYPELENSIIFYIGPMGCNWLREWHDYEEDQIRDKIVQRDHIVHEMMVAHVLRKIISDSQNKKLYKILTFSDDLQLKMRNKFKKNMVYPDLEILISPYDGATVKINIEVEGKELRQSKFEKKLSGLQEQWQQRGILSNPNLLLVVVMHDGRIERLYRYAAAVNRRPEDIYFTTINEFYYGGITGSRWLHFPSKKELPIRFL